MTAQHPLPLQPPDVDLRGMDYLPVYIERLRRSRAMALAAADPAAGFSMRLLWEESWWEVPAGSLENDDLLLAGAARCPMDQWNKRKRVALYGWTLCSDGRLYHKVLCELAWRTWQERLKYRWKNECDRLAKANKKLIEDAQKSGRQHAKLHPIPSFEAWVTVNYPATAAKLFATAATQPAPIVAPARVPAAAEHAHGAGKTPRLTGGVAEKPPDFSAKDGGSRAETALKVEVEDKIIPPTPLGRAAASPAEASEEWQREADFAAFFTAVGQWDAPTRTCWKAWLEMLQGPRPLPEQRLLLAMVAAWRRFCAERARERPLGPARLLREGTLWNFEGQARALLANDTAMAAIDMAEDERAMAARATWGDLRPVLAKVAGGDAAFVAWFGDGWPIEEGNTLVIATPRPFQVNWIKDKYREQIARALGREVVVRQEFPERGAA